jgi:hypothetical protein
MDRDPKIPKCSVWEQRFDSVWAGVTGLLEITTSVHARERLAAARQALDDAGCAELGYEQPDDLGVWRGETCKRCHRRNVVGFAVTDEVWARVTQERWTVLCTTCFDEQAHLLGVSYEFSAVYLVSWSDVAQGGCTSSTSVVDSPPPSRAEGAAAVRCVRRMPACPRCGGDTALDGTTHAVCATGCGWSRRLRHG